MKEVFSLVKSGFSHTWLCVSKHHYDCVQSQIQQGFNARAKTSELIKNKPIREL